MQKTQVQVMVGQTIELVGKHTNREERLVQNETGIQAPTGCYRIHVSTEILVMSPWSILMTSQRILLSGQSEPLG